MQAWAAVSHENVVSVLGSCFTSLPLLSVVEWAEHRSTKTFLRALPHRNPDLALQVIFPSFDILWPGFVYDI